MAKNVKVILTLDDRQFNRSMSKATRSVEDFGNKGKESVSKLDGAFKALAGAIAVGAVIDFANQAQNLQNRLRGVTDNTEQAAAAFELVKGVAERTRSGLSDVGDLFTNLTIATGDMGKTQKEVAQISETFSKSLKISGADANAASGAIRQFGQALASGQLRGDEFNSIMEANPVFMRAVADQLGVTIGEMRDLAFEGALTADVIVAATEDMSGAIDEDFGKTVGTIGEAFVQIQNEITNLLTQVENKTGVFSSFAGLIKLAADNTEFLAKVLAAVFAAAIATAIVNTTVAVFNFAKALQAAYVAGALLQGVTGIGLAKVAAGVAAASAAVLGMNELFDDALEGVQELEEGANNIDLDLPDAPSQTPGAPTITPSGTPAEETRAQKLLRLRREGVQTEKDATAEKKKQEKAAAALARQIQSNLQTAKDTLANSKADLENKLAELELENQLFGLGDKEKEQRREIADLEEQRRTALEAIQALQLSEDPITNQAMMEEKLQRINELYDQMIAKIKEMQEENDIAATNFGTGFMEAFENFRDQVQDNAAFGAKIFETMASGFSDAILNFVETGKLSFKDLFKSLMTEIIKMQANKIFLALFGGAQSFFAGLFDKGGYIPAGQFGIAGERGPEIVNGPARITGTDATARLMGSGKETNQIVYNINAVDVQSFRQALARDPEYIYNLTRVGQRRIPG